MMTKEQRRMYHAYTRTVKNEDDIKNPSMERLNIMKQRLNLLLNQHQKRHHWRIMPMMGTAVKPLMKKNMSRLVLSHKSGLLSMLPGQWII